MSAIGAPEPTETPASRVEQRRAEIVGAARELFREQGIHATTYGEVASRVGVTRGLVYHYFPTRDDLIDAALDAFVAELVDAVAAWDAARRPGHVREALESAIGLLRRLLFGRSHAIPDLAQPANARTYAVYLDRVVEAVADTLERTTVRSYEERYGLPIEHVHETFTMLLYGLVTMVRARPEIPDATLVDIVWQTLRLHEPDHHGSPPGLPGSPPPTAP